MPPPRTPTTPSKSRIFATASTPTKASSATAKSRTLVRPKSPAKPKTVAPAETEKPTPALSIKEAIALKRAEAKKLQTKSPSPSTFDGQDDEPSATSDAPALDDDSLGRLSLRQAIERARSTGSINLATRSLPCLPSALFDMHLGITPGTLKSVPNEPPLPPPSSAELQANTRRSNNPAWYEAQDLQVLKAWNNEIVEIQPEISLFGSLKTIDLHQNKITSLPESIGDLMSLTNLDISHNELASLPESLFSLPELMNLNISHNKLTSLPFNAPFQGTGSTIRRVSTNFFSVAIERASSPLPRLQMLDASQNQIYASAIHLQIPISLTKFDLSSNPLDGDGDNASCQGFLKALGGLQKLTELRMEKAGINDEAIPTSLPASAVFPSLRLFDLAETKVTLDTVKGALKEMKQTLDHNYSTEQALAGVCRVIVGKKMLKEAWEIEIERQAGQRALKVKDVEETAFPRSSRSPGAVALPRRQVAIEAIKERWEIEELLTDGAKRRARAVAAAEEQKALGHGKKPSNGSTVSAASSPSPTPGQNQTTTLSSPKYYSEATLTLTLPPCTPASKAGGHNRAFSLATTPPPVTTTDIAVPTPTLPLNVIVTQPFSNSLRTLVLINRRMDRCFALPGGPTDENILPNLEELDLENCNLPDMISVSRGGSTSGLGSRASEPIIPLITKLFHNLQTLNLSYNALSGFLQDVEALSTLILAKGGRRGLKHLRLRGNGIKDLDGLQGVASMFKGFREVPGWKLDELDIRDNNVEKLPPELGLLPLDVFLVDGNVFRVPQRRVWEREGTKGLLSWLRGRIE